MPLRKNEGKNRGGKKKKTGMSTVLLQTQPIEQQYFLFLFSEVSTINILLWKILAYKKHFFKEQQKK